MKHRVAECRSERTCQACKDKHHSPLCKQSSTIMVPTEWSLIYPVVVVNTFVSNAPFLYLTVFCCSQGVEKGCIRNKWVEVNVTCGALIDIDIRYFPEFLEKLTIQPVWKETRQTEMMMHWIARKIDMFEVEYISWSFLFKLEVRKYLIVTLLSLPNSNYEALLKQNLQNIMNDMDKKTKLSLHLIFGTSGYTKMKVQEMPRVGKPGKVVAELTRFGWILMSPRREAEII